MPYVYEIKNLIDNKKYIGFCSKTPNNSLNYYGSGKKLVKLTPAALLLRKLVKNYMINLKELNHGILEFLDQKRQKENYQKH